MNDEEEERRKKKREENRRELLQRAIKEASKKKGNSATDAAIMKKVLGGLSGKTIAIIFGVVLGIMLFVVVCDYLFQTVINPFSPPKGTTEADAFQELSMYDYYNGCMGKYSGNEKNVLRWRPKVDEEAKKLGISAYADLALAIIQVESHGTPPDVMQSSESAYGVPGKIKTPEESIHFGLLHLKYCIVTIGASRTDASDINKISMILACYNYGTGFYLGVDLYNWKGCKTYSFAQSMAYHNASHSGDPYYVRKVLSAYQSDSSSGKGVGPNNVPVLKQSDKQWGSIKLGEYGEDMSMIGCTFTCFCMSESCRRGQTVFPDKEIQNQHFDASGNFYWPSNYHYVPASDGNLKPIYEKLKKQIPVIVGGDGWRSSHFVIIVKCTSDENHITPASLIIHDPGGNRKTLADYFKDFPNNHAFRSY